MLHKHHYDLHCILICSFKKVVMKGVRCIDTNINYSALYNKKWKKKQKKKFQDFIFGKYN